MSVPEEMSRDEAWSEVQRLNRENRLLREIIAGVRRLIEGDE